MKRIEDKVRVKGRGPGARSLELMMKYGLIWYHKYLANRYRNTVSTSTLNMRTLSKSRY